MGKTVYVGKRLRQCLRRGKAVNPGDGTCSRAARGHAPAQRHAYAVDFLSSAHLHYLDFLHHAMQDPAQHSDHTYVAGPTFDSPMTNQLSSGANNNHAIWVSFLGVKIDFYPSSR